MTRNTRSNLGLLALCATCAVLVSWGVRDNVSTSSVSPPSLDYRTTAEHLAAIADTIEARCPFDTRALRGGFYRVLRVPEGGSSVEEISQHTRLDKAVVSATEVKSAATRDSVWIEHDFELVVECPEEGAFTSADSVTIVQARVEMDYRIEAGDTLWTTVAFDRDGAVIDSVAGRQYHLTALLWDDGEVIACGGDCSDYQGVEEIDYQQALRWQRTAQ